MLTIRLRSPRGSIDPALSSRYFGDHEHFEVARDGACHLDPHTGVGFEVAVEADDSGIASLRIELPTTRPLGFAEQVADELALLTEALALELCLDSGEFAEFRREAFLDDFRAARTRAIAALRAHGLGLPVPFPAALLAASYRWNRSRSDLTHRLGEQVYVPPVMLATVDSVPTTLIVFTDGIPTLIPASVGHVLVHRVELAPMRSMVAREERPVLLSRAAAIALLEGHGAEDPAVAAFRPSYVDPPPELARAISALEVHRSTLLTFTPDRVVEADALVDE